MSDIEEGTVYTLIGGPSYTTVKGTAELRFVKRPKSVDGFTGTAFVLQQMFLINEVKDGVVMRTYMDWRDVPVVEESGI